LIPSDPSLIVVREVQNVKNFKAIALTIATTSLLATPVLAHHPLGGRVPMNAWEGLMSGVAHPVIGLDHLAMVIAIGLFAGVRGQALVLPMAFSLAALLGTSAHLSSLPLPGVELLVSASVLLFGLLMAFQKRLELASLLALLGLAGLFHGYAYGEAIFGARSVAMVSYLVGFTAIQLAISCGAAQVAKAMMDSAKLRSAGLLIAGVGTSLFASQLLKLAGLG
jgi:urease accessory protein